MEVSVPDVRPDVIVVPCVNPNPLPMLHVTDVTEIQELASPAESEIRTECDATIGASAPVICATVIGMLMLLSTNPVIEGAS